MCSLSCKATVVLLTSALASTTGHTASESLPPHVAQAQVAQIFASLTAPDQPGCAVGAMRDGALIYSAGFGKADIATGKPLDAQAIFNIASMSKQFTAFAILLLEQRGALSLDDSIAKYVPELGGYARPVTISHLLHHTGGLRDYISLLELRGRWLTGVATTRETLEILSRQRYPNTPPGALYDYSNTGYFLLGLVVERVSGQPLKEFSKEHIFAPLKMVDTVIIDRYPTHLARLARGYSPTGAGFEVNESAWQQTGDGQIHTTVADLTRWDQNFYTGALGGKQLIRKMLEPGVLASGERLDYAAGLNIGSYRGLATVSHGGGWAGYSSYLVRFPAQKLGVAVLCNREDGPAERYAMAVADMYLANRLADRAAPRVLPQSARIVSAVARASDPARLPAGMYRDASSGVFLRLAVNNGQFHLEAGEDTSGLQEIAPHVFQAADFGEFYLTFVPAQGDAPARLVTRSFNTPAEFQYAADWAPSRLEAYAGTYYSAEADVNAIVSARDGDELMLEVGTRLDRLQPVAENEFAELQEIGEQNSVRFPAHAGPVKEFLFFAPGLRGLRFERRE